MWFLGYDIDEIPPNHSILSKARKRFGRATYEQFFREIVKLCKELSAKQSGLQLFERQRQN